MRRLAARAVILGALAWFAAAPASADDIGPVWQVSRGAGTVYLAGSVHLLDSARSRLPQGFDIAYSDAEVILMELDLDDVDEAAAQQYLLAHAMLPPGETLRARLGAQQYEKLAAEAQKAGLPIEGLAMLEPWAIALTLSQLQMAALGLNPEQGVEKQIERRARADRKPIDGLETLEQQLGVLDRMSPADQARFLDLTLEDADEMQADLDRMLTAWRAADLEALEQLLLEEYTRMPALYRALVADRNRAWLPGIEARLASRDDTLVVVGMLHLVGPDGLLELLERRGLRVERVKP